MALAPHAGFREACNVARKRIEGAAKSYAGDQAGLKKALLDIARTTLSSKILTHDKEHFARLAVDAVLRLKGSTNLDSIHIIKKAGGTLKVRHHAATDSCRPAGRQARELHRVELQMRYLA